MDDDQKTKKQLMAEIAALKDRLEKIESVLLPTEISDKRLSSLPFSLNAPVGLRSLEEQILFARFSV